MTTPRLTAEEMLGAVLKPLFNPEPHPLQEEWSNAHSMDVPTLIERLLDAMQSYADQCVREAIDSAASYYDPDCIHQKLDDESCIAEACGDLCEAGVHSTIIHSIMPLPKPPAGDTP